MKKYKRAGCGLIALVLSGCASTPPAYKRIDPPTAIPINSEAPTDIFGDAARLRKFEAFPVAISESIDSIVRKNSLNSASLREVKGLFCDGNKAKVESTFNVKVIPPKAPPGVPLDKVTESRKKFLEYARYFLKTRFFASATGQQAGRTLFKTGAGSAKLNPDYESVLDPSGLGANERLKDRKYSIPIQSSDRKTIEEFYSKLPYVPQFYETRWIERWNEPNENIQQQFFSIVTGVQTAVLVPKASSFLEVGWSYDGEPLQPKITTAAITEASNTLPKIKSGRLGEPRTQDYMRYHTHVLVSEYGWDYGDLGTVHPLQIAFSKELEFLSENFTFIFSRESVENVFGYKDPLVQQHFGVDYYTGKLNQKTAIDDRHWIWSMVLWASTSLKESPQSDGSVLYTVNLDISHFCELGVALADLESQ